MYYAPRVLVGQQIRSEPVRHCAFVRVTHWITLSCFVALLITGLEIVISHPRFYWGETGNVNMQPLFTIPIPASRDTVPTGYGYVMPDQNGWSRYLHFEAAWVLVLTAWCMALRDCGRATSGRICCRGAARGDGGRYGKRIAQYLRRAPPDASEAHSYNVLQRTAYLSVIFMLFPLVIWTGLALSPAFNAAFPCGCERAGRTAVGAHAAFLRDDCSGALPCGTRCDGGRCGIQEPHAGDDHGARGLMQRGSAHEQHLTTEADHGGLAATAGIAGLAAAGRWRGAMG